MSLQKRKVEMRLGLNGESRNPKAVDERTLLADMSESLPYLREFLVGWKEGKTEFEGGFLGIYLGFGTVQGVLTHSQTRQKAYVTSESWAGVLNALEAGLEAHTLDWRKMTDQQRKGGRAKG